MKATTKLERPARAMKRLNEITFAAVMDERRAEAKRAEEERLAALDAASPVCGREFAKPGRIKGVTVRCTHKRNVHNPCSKCACPSFLGLAPTSRN